MFFDCTKEKCFYGRDFVLAGFSTILTFEEFYFAFFDFFSLSALQRHQKPGIKA